jgi:cold shock CspA family protein
MLFGTISKINDKGFGWIAQDQAQEPDLFFHVHELKGDLRGKFNKHLVGRRVNYRRTACRRGLQATDIVRADEPAEAPAKESTQQSA